MSPVARYIRYTFLHIMFRATHTVLISKNAVFWDVKTCITERIGGLCFTNGATGFRWGMGGQCHSPRSLYREQGDPLLYRRLDGRRIGVDGCEDEIISCTHPGFEPLTVQPVASR